MKSFSTLGILLGALLFSSCDETVKTPDGRIPQEYFSVAQKYVGSYAGKVENSAAELTVGLTNDGRLTLQSSVDLAGEGCQSSIGNLSEFSFDKDDEVINITGAKFHFNANRCLAAIAGDAVVLDMYQRSSGLHLDLNIFEYTEWRHECTIETDPRGYPRHVCRDIPDHSYITGRFLKL